MDRCVRHTSNRICRAVVTKDRWRPGVRNGIGDLAPIDDRSPIVLRTWMRGPLGLVIFVSVGASQVV
jgi:hypothetical protein